MSARSDRRQTLGWQVTAGELLACTADERRLLQTATVMKNSEAQKIIKEELGQRKAWEERTGTAAPWMLLQSNSPFESSEGLFESNSKAVAKSSFRECGGDV